MAEGVDDEGGALSSYTLAADLLTVREILARAVGRLQAEDYARRTESRPQGWSLAETMAHLEAAAAMFSAAVGAALVGQPRLMIPGIIERGQLSAWNRAAIDARAAEPPAEVAARLLATLATQARMVAQLEPADLARTIALPFYSAAPTVAELFGSSLSHVGITHAAQVAAGARVPPLWVGYPPGLLRRQLTRFFHSLGAVYWPERGGELRATVVFSAAGPGGGSWSVSLAPGGAAGRLGAAAAPELELRFADVALLCAFLTYRAPLLRSLLLGRLRVRGDWALARRFPRLFRPT